MPPGETRLNGPLPVSDGYTMTIRGRQEGTSISLDFELVLASRAQLVGGDGIYGWPVVADLDWFPDQATSAVAR